MLGLTRACDWAYGVVVAMIFRSPSFATTSRADMPFTSKQTMPAESSSFRGVCLCTERLRSGLTFVVLQAFAQGSQREQRALQTRGLNVAFERYD